MNRLIRIAEFRSDGGSALAAINSGCGRAIQAIGISTLRRDFAADLLQKQRPGWRRAGNL